MALRPKTITGKLFVVGLIVVAFVAWMSGPVVWAVIAVLAVAATLWYLRYRRIQRARSEAFVGEFSFGDVVQRMRTRAALEPSTR